MNSNRVRNIIKKVVNEQKPGLPRHGRCVDEQGQPASWSQWNVQGICGGGCSSDDDCICDSNTCCTCDYSQSQYNPDQDLTVGLAPSPGNREFPTYTLGEQEEKMAADVKGINFKKEFKRIHDKLDRLMLFAEGI